MKKEEKVNETKVKEVKVKVEEEKETKSIPGIYIASLAVGISGIVISGFPILGLLVSIAGIIVSVIAMKKLKAQGEKHGFVTAGLVTSIVGTVISAIVTVITVLALIGIGVFYNNSASNILDKANAAAKDAETTTFNSKFLIYEGENQPGVMVNMLLEEVVQNNNSSSNNKIRVDADYDTGIQFVGNPPTKILSKARASEKYDVEVEKDYTGRVSKIIIEK